MSYKSRLAMRSGLWGAHATISVVSDGDLTQNFMREISVTSERTNQEARAREDALYEMRARLKAALYLVEKELAAELAKRPQADRERIEQRIEAAEASFWETV